MPALAEPLPVAKSMAPVEAQPTVKSMAPTTESVPEGGEETAMEVPDLPVLEIVESQSMPGVHLDVVGSDAVVTVDATLLASPERDRESRTQRLSTFLSTRFHHTPVPRTASMQTPIRDNISEEDTQQAQVVKPVQDMAPLHSTIECMAEAVETAMRV